MANSIEVFGFCGANCKHRVLTIDQTAELIQEMAANGFQVPDEYIPKTAVNSIIEQNTGRELKIFIGTQEEYNNWTGDKNNVFAIISDDPTLANLNEILKQQGQSIVSINSKFSSKSITGFGDYIIPKRKVLFRGKAYVDGSAATSSIFDAWTPVTISEEVNIGDTIELEFYLSQTTNVQFYKVKIENGSSSAGNGAKVSFPCNTGDNCLECYFAHIRFKGTTCEFTPFWHISINVGDLSGDNGYAGFELRGIYKIVE